jgi:hypothetical protein
MKKLISVIGVVVIVGLAFFGGIKYQQNQNNKVYSASTNAANDFIFGTIASEDADRETYDNLNETYRSNITKENFDNIYSSLKGGEITKTYTMTSPVENQTFYTIKTKDQKTVTVAVTTLKVNSKWVVTLSNIIEG